MRREMRDEDIRNHADRDRIEERGGARNPEACKLREHAGQNPLCLRPSRRSRIQLPSIDLLPERCTFTKLIFRELRQPQLIVIAAS
jgi:hypothetical protein